MASEEAASASEEDLRQTHVIQPQIVFPMFEKNFVVQSNTALKKPLLSVFEAEETEEDPPFVTGVTGPGEDGICDEGLLTVGAASN